MADESTIILPTNASVAAQIAEALESVNTAITNLQTAITNVYNKSDVYTKAEVAALHAVINASISAHTGSTSIHTSAQEKETWNAKLDSTTGYTRTLADSTFAAKSIEPTVASLQTGKADKSNTYTKSEVNTLVASMSGKTFNYGDWSNGALASAIKELYTALGGTIQGTQA